MDQDSLKFTDPSASDSKFGDKRLALPRLALFSNFEISNLLLSTEVSILSNKSPNLILPVQLKVK